jgi:hypothetical protein
MKELKILIIIFITLIVLGASFIFLAPYFQVNISFDPTKEPPPKIEAKLSTSRILYQNNERVSFEAKLKASRLVENVTLHLYGLQGKKDRFLIDESKSVNLEAGQENSVIFVARLPNCFSCAGLGSGTFPVKLEVIKNNRILANEVIEIHLVSANE